MTNQSNDELASRLEMIAAELEFADTGRAPDSHIATRERRQEIMKSWASQIREVIADFTRTPSGDRYAQGIEDAAKLTDADDFVHTSGYRCGRGVAIAMRIRALIPVSPTLLTEEESQEVIGAMPLQAFPTSTAPVELGERDFVFTDDRPCTWKGSPSRRSASPVTVPVCVKLSVEQCAAQFELYAQTHPSPDSQHSLRFCADFLREYAVEPEHEAGCNCKCEFPTAQGDTEWCPFVYLGKACGLPANPPHSHRVGRQAEWKVVDAGKRVRRRV